MGKAFGSNTKAEQGRARKVAAKEAQKEKERNIKESAEEKQWQEGAKDTSKKHAEEAKRLEKLIKRQERKSIEEQEAKDAPKFKDSKSKALPTTSGPTLMLSSAMNWSLSPIEDPIVSTPEYSASNIDDALLLLESASQSASSVAVEKHPERRMKAAFAAFEARELPKLRAENPSLRHTQLLERLHKMWQKSPENPFNQLHVAHNLTKEEQDRIVRDDMDKNLERMRLK
jgi:hypothetical protein